MKRVCAKRSADGRFHTENTEGNRTEDTEKKGIGRKGMKPGGSAEDDIFSRGGAHSLHGCTAPWLVAEDNRLWRTGSPLLSMISVDSSPPLRVSAPLRLCVESPLPLETR